MFNESAYLQRRNRLRSEIASGIILLLGNEESPMNYADNTYHFRQDSSFLYFFGINRPGLFAILDTEKGTDTVYGEDYTVEDFVWRGKQPTILEEGSLAGVKETGTLAELNSVLSASLKAGRIIHFLPPYRAENILKLSNLLGINPSKVSQSASIPLVKAVVSQRNFKSEEEIALYLPSQYRSK